MYTIKTDTQKNRLYVTLNGFFLYKEMKECTDKTIEKAGELRPEFDVITDISQFKPVGQDTLNEVKRGQAYFKESGIRHGIRVEGKAKLVSNQFNRVGKSVDYCPETVETIEDAEIILDTLAQSVH